MQPKLEVCKERNFGNHKSSQGKFGKHKFTNIYEIYTLCTQSKVNPQINAYDKRILSCVCVYIYGIHLFVICINWISITAYLYVYEPRKQPFNLYRQAHQKEFERHGSQTTHGIYNYNQHLLNDCYVLCLIFYAFYPNLVHIIFMKNVEVKKQCLHGFAL